MDLNVRKYGYNRKAIRSGSGAGENVASEHFDEMIGSSELNIYRHPGRRVSGYEPLKLFLEAGGCEVVHLMEPNPAVGPGYETIRITCKGGQIAVPMLRRAHSWAHQRNLTHLFYKKGTTSINRLTLREGL